MPLTHDEVIALKNEIIDDCSDIFVKIDKCNDIQRKTSNKFANDDKRIEKLTDRMETWNKLLWTITSSSIGALVVSFLELIIK